MEVSQDILHATKTTPKFTLAQTCAAKCVSVYDGDTAQFVFHVAPGAGCYRFSCRLLGYNSAEIKTNDPVEKKKAKESRDALANSILDKIVQLEIGDFDKYGRPLVRVFHDGKNINEWMLEAGHGKPYTGSGSKDW